MSRAYNDPGVLRTIVIVLACVGLGLGARLAAVSVARDRAEAHVLRLLEGCTSPSDFDHR